MKIEELIDRGDETGNLLDMQRSILAELRRMLHRVDAAYVGYETAGDVLFRVDQVSRYVDATAKTLQELNLRLLSFDIAEFSAEEAKPIVDELAVFLERFGRRFGTLREDILRDVEEMRRDCHAKRWKACADTLAAETSRFRHIASVKIPDAQRILADASLFYGAGGTLVSLMSRIGDSARKVWGKLNAKLRELERRNHRIEDVGARLAELARLDEEDVPHRWLQRRREGAKTSWRSRHTDRRDYRGRNRRSCSGVRRLAACAEQGLNRGKTVTSHHVK